ncbi:Peptidase M23 domain-containing protein [Desulfonema limicola]|uniref:Peptidase M23 domain-containing protein n=2 Tax=Desulfonema limicola TaxID=45656 RepID=A0A975GEY4_9BACT|nr:Peptidase M23 domain-containing protein [Desulfonema limicola]
MKIRIVAAITCIAVIVIALILVLRLEGENPVLKIDGLSSSLKASQNFFISVSDKKSGIRRIQVVLNKNDKETVLYEKELPMTNFIMGGSVYDYEFDLQIKPKEIGISDGQGILSIYVSDCSWRGWLHGNNTIIKQEVIIDTVKPKINVVSQQHNISQGGSGLVVYSLSEPCPENGVVVGNNFFPGYSASKIPGVKEDHFYMSFIALNYRQGKETQMFIKAVDQAGNASKTGFLHYIKPVTFKKDIINISDRFLDQKLPEFDDDLPENASAVEKFLIVNNKLRTNNTKKLKSIGNNTENTLFWQGPFLRLPNSARKASFADHREYRYNGEKIDEQYHMGIDLASTAHTPVPASNSGKVVFTGYIGIYGKTVVIDHGFGLFSAYSHLNTIETEADKIVSKGEIIGKTGLTGLAGGDHLHFAMILHNTFVNPVEWWDPVWIKNNITNKIKEIKSKG